MWSPDLYKLHRSNSEQNFLKAKTSIRNIRLSSLYVKQVSSLLASWASSYRENPQESPDRGFPALGSQIQCHRQSEKLPRWWFELWWKLAIDTSFFFRQHRCKRLQFPSSLQCFWRQVSKKWQVDLVSDKIFILVLRFEHQIEMSLGKALDALCGNPNLYAASRRGTTPSSSCIWVASQLDVKILNYTIFSHTAFAKAAQLQIFQFHLIFNKHIFFLLPNLVEFAASAKLPSWLSQAPWLPWLSVQLVLSYA